jgi:hypothetical protein
MLVLSPRERDVERACNPSGRAGARKVVATLDALEFSAESFSWTMREALRSGQAPTGRSPDGPAREAVATASRK